MRPIVFKSRSVADFTGYAIFEDFECFWTSSLTFAPTERKKSSFLPASSWFLSSAVGLQPIWHQVKASRWESLSLVLWVSGSWPVESSGGGRFSPVRLAPGERQSR